MDKGVLEIFAERSKQRLEELDWTHQKFADELGVTRSMVTKYLAGNTALGIDLLAKWAATLGVSMRWLLGEDREEAREIPVRPPTDMDVIGYIFSRLEVEPVRKEILLFLIHADKKILEIVNSALRPFLKRDKAKSSRTG